ncbi:MAG: translin family protein [Methanomassiliicoccales archaeon]|jgi:translin|nr:translin family protein [Methanomassiliicoccales archaeon]
MRNLEEIADRIQYKLDEKDTVREVAIKSSRAIIRISTGIVHSIHRREDVKEALAEAKEEVHRLRSLLEDHPDIWNSGLVEDAMAEMAEASILLAIVNNEELPDPEELNITSTSYLLGLADVIGELRRFALEALRKDKTDEAVKYLDMMEDLFLVLMRFDYPDAIVPIRRKQDIARSLLEKTRGEIAVAVSSKRLQEKLEEFRRHLDISES